MATEQPFEFDVFISYSSQDELWVTETLLPRLEQGGVKVCIDFRDFKPGRPSLLNMQHAVRYSRHTLLVLTENWFGSEWTLFESILSSTKDPAGLRQRTIPLQLRKSEPPETADFVAALSYVDFTRADRATIAWRMLFTALGKPPESESPSQSQPEHWLLAHPYPMPPNFTGRVAERQMLDEWLKAEAAHPLLSIRALGGFGKSALVWHWLTHDVSPAAWPRVVWWSFYEGDASFDRFLAETLAYLSGGTLDAEIRSGKNAVNLLLQMLRTPGTLLALDGFERLLRAFGGLDAAYQGDEVQRAGQDRDCISPLAEWFLYNLATLPQLRSKVLLTTRLCPRILEARGGGLLAGCREAELKEMQPADAVTFFHAQGIRGTRTEIETACAHYGYHPLSLRLLAGLVLSDFQQPGDIAAAQRLDVSGDLIQRQHHVLETAYNSLAPSRQALLGFIACFRSPVSYATLKVVAEGSLDTDLRDLIARGLLHHDVREGRFDLHPIVRRYAYDRLAAPDREAAHIRLRDYFAAVPAPGKVTRLEDLATVIELYHHTVRAGRLDGAITLFRDRLHDSLYYQLGAYLLIIDLLRPLFPDGEDRPPRLKDEDACGWTLAVLANSFSPSGQPRRAVPLYEQHNAIYEKRGDKENLATGLGSVADDQSKIGALRAAEANIRRRISLLREIKNDGQEGTSLSQLGRVLAYKGNWSESSEVLDAAEVIKKQTAHVQAQGIIWAYRVLRELLRLRTSALSITRNSQPAIDAARRALELADETARTLYPHERDYVRANWLQGAAHRVAGQLDEAERHLHEALERCRRINLVDHEADVLIDLARLSAATGAADEAQRLAEEARLIAERSGYVLQGADAHLELARLALSRNDLAQAREHAQQARTLATCDGPPDYTYKAAYDEAGALLKELDLSGGTQDNG